MVNSVKNLKNKKYRLRTNNNGFIVGPEWKNNKDVITDIIFVGGSTTECMYVEEINRFPYLLSKLIKKKNGSNLNILNGGVAGNHSVHSLINLIANLKLQLILKQQAIVIILNLVSNQYQLIVHFLMGKLGKNNLVI